MPPLSFFRSSSSGTAVQSNSNSNANSNSGNHNQSQNQSQPTLSPPSSSQAQTQLSSSSARVSTPPSPRTQLQTVSPAGMNAPSQSGMGGPDPSPLHGSNTASQHPSTSGQPGEGPSRFGSGSWSRGGKKSRFSRNTTTSHPAGSGSGGASPTRPGPGHPVDLYPGSAGEDGTGGRRMSSITEGIPFSSPSNVSVFPSLQPITGGGLASNVGPRSASPSRSFPTSNPHSHSHTHHLSLSIPSFSADMPPPSPRARPKPRGYSESNNGEKRRAGWFAGFVPGATGSEGHGQEEVRTKRLGSGSSVLSNPFSTKEPEQGSSLPPRGSIEEDTNVFGTPAVNRSASFKLGFRNRVSSSTKPSGSTSGLNISAPIGPMVKASQEEILQEFGRLQMNSAVEPVHKDVRSTSLDQGLKLRSSSFTAGERPSFSSGTLEDKDGGVFKLASRVMPTGVPNTAPIQRPVTPERTQLAQIPGTPLAQTRSGSYQGTSHANNTYPTPLSPPMRRPTVVSRQSGQSPAPFAWPSRGVEAGCLSPRHPPPRKDSFEVYTSAGEGQGSTFRAPSPCESRTSPSHVEWLSRKPSSSFDHHSREFSFGPARPIDERTTKKKPAPLLPQANGLQQLPHLKQRASDDSEDRKYSTSGVEADDDSEEQLSSVEDAIITRAERVVSPRKDSFSSTSFSVGTTPPRSPGLVARDTKEEFQVETVCVPSADGETMRWEIVVRRLPAGSSINSSANTSTTGPVQLSQSRTSTRAPMTASSVNLSLSLDRPTGKLAFLSLPATTSDPHATPIRSRAPQSSAIGAVKARMDSSPAPSPSPSPSPYSRESGLGRAAPVRPAADPSNMASPTFAPSARAMRTGDRRQASSSSAALWPNSPLSPGAPITPVSPPGSPRDIVVRQRRKASLQGGVLYTRTQDNQV